MRWRIRFVHRLGDHEIREVETDGGLPPHVRLVSPGGQFIDHYEWMSRRVPVGPCERLQLGEYGTPEGHRYEARLVYTHTTYFATGRRREGNEAG